jgi:lipooligosaccharide transport system ATP-binding protein
MIYGYAPLGGGSLSVFGMDVATSARAIKARTGVSQQEDNLDPDFTVRVNLTVHARYFGIPKNVAAQRADELLEFMGLSEKAGARMSEISGGMKRRLIVARALVNAPELLILDEPTIGLDPQSRQQVWTRVRQLRKAGTTILLTTHYLEEAAQLCDRLVIMDRGRILVDGAPGALVQEHIGKDVVEVWGAGDDLLAHVRSRGWRHEKLPDRIVIATEDGEQVHHDIAGQFAVDQLFLRPANLEDVFLKLTGRGLRD